MAARAGASGGAGGIAGSTPSPAGCPARPARRRAATRDARRAPERAAGLGEIRGMGARRLLPFLLCLVAEAQSAAHKSDFIST